MQQVSDQPSRPRTFGKCRSKMTYLAAAVRVVAVGELADGRRAVPGGVGARGVLVAAGARVDGRVVAIVTVGAGAVRCVRKLHDAHSMSGRLLGEHPNRRPDGVRTSSHNASNLRRALDRHLARPSNACSGSAKEPSEQALRNSEPRL